MRMLLLGGTAWLGREITRSALDAGHEVTCLARGADVVDGARLVRADRDEPGAYAAVAQEHWDVVIDVSRQPGQVRSAVAALAARADRFVFVSTCSVYATHDAGGQDEHAPTLSPLDADTMSSLEEYGHAKVACEQAVIGGFGDERSLVIRPALIGGPGDGSGRSTYWPWRFAHPSNEAGAVLIPDAPDQPTSVIDVRDLAEWIVRAAGAGLVGVFNATGDVVTLAEHLRVARDAAGHEGAAVAAPIDWLVAREVHGWVGPRSLPIWLDDPADIGIHLHSNERAKTAGLLLRPLSETLGDVIVSDKPASGLTDDEERALLSELLTPGL
ncbi:NAD-dependent epimerase/dehydratase family protein [Microbacterium sp. ZW T5_56]|uniref:NAD-dependent epimerase/dehydratase family protein n=1 Tax=Microbacterium sp. ZW T5_56 TaxID=3378081 RepID=UPI003852F058